MKAKIVLAHVCSLGDVSTSSQPRHSKFEKKKDYVYMNTMQRPKSNLFFEEKALSPKKSEESEELSSFTNTTNSSKYKIFFLAKNDSTPIDVTCNFNKDLSVKDALLQVLKLFNQDLKKRSQGFTLNENVQFWEFRFAKKNGLPKTDYPALDEYNSMDNIGSSALSLCCKDMNNGYISSNESSPSSCSIKEDFRGTAITAISRSYMNSLSSQKEVQVKKKEVDLKKPKQKSKFCLFTFFCL